MAFSSHAFQSYVSCQSRLRRSEHNLVLMVTVELFRAMQRQGLVLVQLFTDPFVCCLFWSLHFCVFPEPICGIKAESISFLSTHPLVLTALLCLMHCHLISLGIDFQSRPRLECFCTETTEPVCARNRTSRRKKSKSVRV